MSAEFLDLMRIVERLSIEKDPPLITQVQSIDDAILVLIGKDNKLRQDALQVLRGFGSKRKIVWGSISTYLVFYYHLVFENGDEEAAALFRNVLQNSEKKGQVSLQEQRILNLISKAHSLKETQTMDAGQQSRIFEDFIREETDGDTLVELVGWLLYVKLGGLTDLTRIIQRLKRSTKGIDIDEAVASHYLVPTNESEQPIDNYFIFMAEKEESRLSEYRYLIRKRDSITSRRDARLSHIQNSRPLRIGIGIGVTVVAIVGAFAYSIMTQKPTINEDGTIQIGADWVFVVIVSVLVVIFALPLGKVPSIIISCIAKLSTIRENRSLTAMQIEIKLLTDSNEP